jgi:hypothetical protein
MVRLNLLAADGSGTPRPVGPAGSGGGFTWTPDGSHVLVLTEGSTSPLLLDPVTGASEPAPWSAPAFPDWQRLAP